MTNHFAGRFSDVWGRKVVLIARWLVAAPVPFALMWAPSWGFVLGANVLLGISQGLTWSATTSTTAWHGPLVFAAAGLSLTHIGTLAAAYPGVWGIAQHVAHPTWRASSVGVYRPWRDLGYAVGALLAGAVADAFGLRAAVLAIAALTAGSGLVALVRMREMHSARRTLSPPDPR